MTKTIYSTLIFTLFTSVALACKPGPWEECKSYSKSVPLKKYEVLYAEIKSYQEQMDKFLMAGTGRTSCFNNRFANHFGKQLLAELKATKGKSCRENLGRVKTHFKHLVALDSDEFQSLSPEAKPSMKLKAIALDQEIDDVLK